jgi:hypothetical protein
MAERRTRRRFTAAFKVQAVKRLLDGRSLSEVATERGLSTGQRGLLILGVMAVTLVGIVGLELREADLRLVRLPGFGPKQPRPSHSALG